MKEVTRKFIEPETKRECEKLRCVRCVYWYNGRKEGIHRNHLVGCTIKGKLKDSA